jgi:hypothetical protein
MMEDRIFLVLFELIRPSIRGIKDPGFPLVR